MTGKDLIQDMLLEAAPVPNGKKFVILFDIDETLLSPRNIFIHKIYPDGKDEKLTPDDYAKEDVAAAKQSGIKYDYREFRNPDTVKKSITTGEPIWKNLRVFDTYVNAGWDVGILTARGLEETVYAALEKWLMFRNAKGELEPIGKKLARNLVHAVNDEVKVYPGTNDFEKKAAVIREYSKKYDMVKFIDDTIPTLNKVKEMCKKENIKNVVVIQAWKRGE